MIMAELSRGRVREVIEMIMRDVGVDESVVVETVNEDAVKILAGDKVVEIPMSEVQEFVVNVILEAFEIIGNKVVKYFKRCLEEKIQEIRSELSSEKIIVTVGGRVVELDMKKAVSMAMILTEKAWSEGGP